MPSQSFLSLLTFSQAAEETGYTTRWLRTLVSRGELEVVHHGPPKAGRHSSARLKRSQIEKLLSDKTTNYWKRNGDEEL